jgi:hypothetical protein
LMKTEPVMCMLLSRATTTSGFPGATRARAELAAQRRNVSGSPEKMLRSGIAAAASCPPAAQVQDALVAEQPVLAP